MDIKIEKGVHSINSSYRGHCKDIRCYIITIPTKDFIREVFLEYKDITSPEYYYTTIDILRSVKKIKAFYYKECDEEKIELYLAYPSEKNKRFDTLIDFSAPVVELSKAGRFNINEYKGLPSYVFEDLKEDALSIIIKELKKEGVTI